MGFATSAPSPSPTPYKDIPKPWKGHVNFETLKRCLYQKMCSNVYAPSLASDRTKHKICPDNQQTFRKGSM